MYLTMMKAKIHRAMVTQCDMHYQGSISVDEDCSIASAFCRNEQVDVLNINTGARFTTYAIPAPRGSKTIGINGAAARLAQTEDIYHYRLRKWTKKRPKRMSRQFFCRKKKRNWQSGACSSAG